METRHLFIISLSFLVSSGLLAQNFIYKGDRRYEATPSWTFKSNGGTCSPLELVVAKHDFGGYLLISSALSLGRHYIYGTIYVFLDNGDIIKCFDKGIRDKVDGKFISLYNFTITEIEKLKRNRIDLIRYNYRDELGEDGTCTAKNELLIYFGNSELQYYETNVDIEVLFGKSKDEDTNEDSKSSKNKNPEKIPLDLLISTVFQSSFNQNDNIFTKNGYIFSGTINLNLGPEPMLAYTYLYPNDVQYIINYEPKNGALSYQVSDDLYNEYSSYIKVNYKYIKELNQQNISQKMYSKGNHRIILQVMNGKKQILIFKGS